MTEKTITPLELHTTPYLILYVDFLGSKERILTDKNDESLQEIYSIYNVAINEKMELTQRLLSMPK